MIEALELPTDRFETTELSGLKKKNCIFGKNGTGKTSITTAIKEQYSDDYDVRVFQGFESVLTENRELATIALGTENAELQPQIDEAKSKVDNLKSQVESRIEEENLYSKWQNSNQDYNIQSGKIDKILRDSAKEIKDEHLDWTGANYDIRKIGEELSSAHKLTDEEIQENITIFKQEAMDNLEKMSFPNINMQELLDRTNALLQTEVVKSAVLEFTQIQQSWVQDGLNIHEHDGVFASASECLFCGNTISDERIQSLNSFFDDELKSLQGGLSTLSAEISEKKSEINKLTIDRTLFYPSLYNQIDILELQLLKTNKGSMKFLELLTEALKMKSQNPFQSIDEIKVEVLPEYHEVKAEYDKVFDNNHSFGSALESEKEQAKNKLRFDQIAIKLEDKNYEIEYAKLKSLKETKAIAEKSFNDIKRELSTEKDKLKVLVEQTKDEGLAAEKINASLKRLGNASFKLIKTDDEQQGQYSIQALDKEGSQRGIEALSTGEKNIIAFLYFLHNLENPELETQQPKIVVFDDPMNSNDDTVQYLIISKLQKTLKEGEFEQLFLLTHNVHFYLNVRYKWWNGSKKPSYDKTTYHLKKVGRKSEIQYIQNDSEDLKTSYQALWHELKWLYERQKPDFMLNPIRRILETYQKFNEIAEMFPEDEESEKLFNVNSHSIDDLEADLNGKDREAIIDKLKQTFQTLDATAHFNAYWAEEIEENA